MNTTVQLQKDHSFQNQIRRTFTLQKGASLSGDLRLFASTWPFGIFHHDQAGSLGVEFTFPYENKTWFYRGIIDCRTLWPAPGAKIKFPTNSETFPVGPMLGMRDDRDDYHYLLPYGSPRFFRLKYVGFECWASAQASELNIKIRHFLPGDDHVVISHSIPIEDVLFHKERKLNYDAEGFLEEEYLLHPFVRVEELSQ